MEELDFKIDFPDDTNPVYGFRAWTFEMTKSGIDFPLVLRNISPDRKIFWSSEGWTYATCHEPLTGAWAGQIRCPGPVPNWDCECGLYAWHDCRKVHCYIGSKIVGAVVGQGMSEYGVIRHGREGWRAEAAKPIAFVKPRTSNNPLPNPPPSTYRYYDRLDSSVTGIIEQLAYRLGARLFDTIEDMEDWVKHESGYTSFWTPADQAEYEKKWYEDRSL